MKNNSLLLIMISRISVSLSKKKDFLFKNLKMFKLSKQILFLNYFLLILL